MPPSINRNSPSLFTRNGFSTARLMAYCFAAVLLMALDQRGAYNQKVRASLATLVSPVQMLVSLPVEMFEAIGENLTDRKNLHANNQNLEDRLLRQQVKLSRLNALEDETRRLRSLLGARSGLRVNTLVAELLHIDLDPYSHKVIVDRGQNDGVFAGMVVLDAGGVMGQVAIASPETAEIILISDPDHALPVQVARTGMRSIAFGTGDTSILMLPNVSINADIKQGDLLQTSGMGQLFPAGYSVARVMSVERSPGHPFARVWARPLAQLDRAREVLVLFPEKKTEKPTEGNTVDSAEDDTESAALPSADPNPPETDTSAGSDNR
ncbi:MAG: rod shape-determining protein MreC [Xanthomonadales bacterium]|nr:rod shape-determining protein MreC [Xanthomonadales bacterium]